MTFLYIYIYIYIYIWQNELAVLESKRRQNSLIKFNFTKRKNNIIHFTLLTVITLIQRLYNLNTCPHKHGPID